ncbi:uncharacterized protein LOC104903741 [Beta vulgaris subsp. vulgaris]|uniref:uncharacterized protein LOC104903741 n=1 Tax=Beta vulgaris subsp. vulgaris TaxID=3555 RepID=UPI002036C37E|nr:uncharacterized protein LOC104903741 [Beta vulgaris subsp. vulgaris]
MEGSYNFTQHISKMNYDSSSSSLGSEFFYYMVQDYIEWSQSVDAEQQNEEEIVPRTRKCVRREREEAHERFFMIISATNLYTLRIFFVEGFVYMHKHVFLRIAEGVKTEDDQLYTQKPDATGRMDASALQKCTAAIRMLAYCSSYDAVDDYLKIASSTARECLLHFVEGVVAIFGPEYLRKPNANDIERLLHEGFFFGTPGLCNDINVLQRSPVFDDVLQGRAPEISFSVNGTTYNMNYYFTDDICPR